jgi:hypothetical protein
MCYKTIVVCYKTGCGKELESTDGKCTEAIEKKKAFGKCAMGVTTLYSRSSSKVCGGHDSDDDN